MLKDTINITFCDDIFFLIIGISFYNYRIKKSIGGQNLFLHNLL